MKYSSTLLILIYVFPMQRYIKNAIFLRPENKKYTKNFYSKIKSFKLFENYRLVHFIGKA